MNVASSHTRRPQKRRHIDRTIVLFLAIFTLLAITSIVLLNRASHQPQTAASASAAPVDSASLLPLAPSVAPIHGFHDMPRIPQQPLPTRAVADGGPQANLDLPLQRWDWGVIPRRPPVQKTFPIQNRGDEPLLITQVVTSCGCTTADLNSSVIPPGQRADLVVTFDHDFHETSGPVTRIVWLETNDPDTPLVEVRVDANVTP